MLTLITNLNLYIIREGDMLINRCRVASGSNAITEERYFVHRVNYEDEQFCVISKLGTDKSAGFQAAKRQHLLNGEWYFSA